MEMDAPEAMAREAMRETMARYNQAGDRGRIEELASCFALDGVLVVGDDAPIEGRDAIRSFMEGVADFGRAQAAHPLLRHHVSSVLVERTSADEGAAKSYFFAITDIGPDHWGSYRDRFRRVDNRWLFAHRSVRVDGYAPGSRFRSRSQAPSQVPSDKSTR
jgi:hypothetical protein